MVDHARINNTMGKMAYYLETHKSICVSVSGGADSDIIVHIIATNFREQLHKTHFVFANTGLEYKATIRHLADLEKKYNIKIERVRGMPIPLAVRKYGVPFISKQVSEYMGRLQSHRFCWCDGSLDDLCEKFGECRAALRWWCNDWGNKSRFNIDWNKGLKDFLITNGISFKASAICCQKSKKDPLIKFQKSVNCDLVITGERKSEGGQRARKQSCFEKSHGFDHYMPLFFWNDETKSYYEATEKIGHSDRYAVYGLERTGCVGCPFSQHRKEELEIMKKYEPNLYKACMNVFGESYRLMDKFEIHRHKIRNEVGESNWRF